MFDNDRYITREISERVPLALQLLMWHMIDEIKVKKDYLQVFEIRPYKEGLLEVIHRQEIPKFTSTLIINNIGIESKMKIFVTDNLEYSMMFMNYEY